MNNVNKRRRRKEGIHRRVCRKARLIPSFAREQQGRILTVHLVVKRKKSVGVVLYDVVVPLVALRDTDVERVAGTGRESRQ
jgi:hypothetical protein